MINNLQHAEATVVSNIPLGQTWHYGMALMGRTHDSAAVMWEVVHVCGDAGGVDPIAAIEGHHSEAHHGPVRQ